MIDKEIEIFDSTGAYGAARAVGCEPNDFKSYSEEITKNDYVKSFEPQKQKELYLDAYKTWKQNLEKIIN